MPLHSSPQHTITLTPELARHVAVIASHVPGQADEPRTVLHRVGLIQLDSLTRVDRAHRLTCLARLPRAARAREIDGQLWSRGEAISFETYTHASALIPIEDWPLFRLNRLSAALRRDSPGDTELSGVTALIRASDHGLTLARIEETAPRAGGGWDWSESKRITEHLVWRGEVVSTDRRLNRRVYDVPERRIPAELRDSVPSRAQILVGLANRAIRSLGVATTADVARHYNLVPADAGFGLEHGDALPARVEGWGTPAWLSPDPATTAAVDSPGTVPEDPRFIGPFDPLIRDRDRSRRVFNFDYTFEAYKPASKRVYGHYVLGVLVGTRFMGRVDVRRDGKVLAVDGIFPEPGGNLAQFRDAVGTAAETLAEQMGLTLEIRNPTNTLSTDCG
ncbi:winged helix-turn-helix domain-containing protein [Mycetocola lacteus]|uniref:Winged helix-turn-helix domain-containing protein n=1 Tax=Mycetocola lacteus TaxID=76637 RepID=A0A3L7AI14_9MICO|nr:crosslink repair DNA glycosylase YcaQ family protein [Mycetocola lacteus]RLP79360.1 winged helix-turn-helix domain-containing protein [Mycetocola lacteus]